MAPKAVRFTDWDAGAIQRRMLKATSALVNASPFDQRTAGRRSKRQVFRSSEGRQLLAR